jgi:hypothetical protein
MDLPKILENMLIAATKDSSLKSWNIYQEKTGHVVFKLKFATTTESMDRDHEEYHVWDSTI